MNESLHGVDGTPDFKDEQLRAGAETVQDLGGAGLQASGVTAETASDEPAEDGAPSASVEIGHNFEIPTLEEFPRLMPLLRAPATPHFHKRDESITVYTHAHAARKIEAEERTDEQRQLLEDIATLKRFAPYSSMFKDVYTPQELHPLAEQLRRLSAKNRPDFNEVEGRIVDIIEAHPGYVTNLNIDTIVRRVHAGRLGGTRWENLVKMASGAVSALHNRLMANPNWAAYVITMEDPEPKPMDLGSIYQFVASSHASDVLGARNQQIQGSRREAFEFNCGAINQWRDDNRDAIRRLPSSIAGNDERISAAWELDNLINVMNKRLTGEDRTGKFKNFKYDPQGALNLQRRIGHLVDSIRSNLTEAQEAAEREIVPLDLE